MLTSRKMWPLHRCCWHRRSICGGVNDTSCQFAASVINTLGSHCAANISVLWIRSGLIADRIRIKFSISMRIRILVVLKKLSHKKLNFLREKQIKIYLKVKTYLRRDKSLIEKYLLILVNFHRSGSAFPMEPDQRQPNQCGTPMRIRIHNTIIYPKLWNRAEVMNRRSEEGDSWKMPVRQNLVKKFLWSSVTGTLPLPFLFLPIISMAVLQL
jgi:hypothetical protein